MSDLSKYAVMTGILLISAYISAAPVSGSVLSLEQAIITALDNNPSLQIMHERIAQAEARVGEAIARFYPHVQARLSYEHSDNPSRAFGMIISQRRLDFNGMDFNHPGGVDNYRPEILATYSLYNGGQDLQQHKAAELGVTAAALHESAARNQLIEWVTSAFYGILAAREAHKIARQSLEAVQSELTHTRNRYDAGSALKSDVLSLEVQLAEARDNEIRTSSAIDLALSGLKTLMGLDSGHPLNVADTAIRETPRLDAAFTALLVQAIAQRPEARAARTQVEITEHQLKAAQGAHLPKADAYVSYGSDSKNLNYSTNRDNVTAGVTVSMDIFSGFAGSERIKNAEREVAIAKLMAKKVQLAIEDELKSAYLKLKDAIERLNVTVASVAAAEEALRLIQERRLAGAETVTRYIEAETARAQAQSRSVSARYDALRAGAELKRVLGCLATECTENSPDSNDPGFGALPSYAPSGAPR